MSIETIYSMTSFCTSAFRQCILDIIAGQAGGDLLICAALHFSMIRGREAVTWMEVRRDGPDIF